MVLMAFSGLIVAASEDERQQIHGQLEQSRLKLEERVVQRTRELQHANVKLEREVRQREHTADALRSLLSATALYTDEAFLRGCARDLAAIYGVRYALIGVFADDSQTSIRTLAVWAGDDFADNFTYDLEGSPCQDVLDLNMELLPEGAARQYPRDELLIQMGIDSYFGAPLLSPDNRLMGLVSVMDDKPMALQPWSQPMLGIYANRIAQEYDRKMTSDELKLAASVFNESVEAIMIADSNGVILRVNPAFSRITGYSAAESIGQNPRLLRSAHHGQEFYRDFWHNLLEQGNWQGEIWNRRKSGETFPAWQTITAVYDSEGQVARYIAIFSDITDRKLSEERIFHLAHFDVVTGLPNRAAFQNHLERAIVHAERRHKQLSLLFLDLDHFKLINDTSGHPAGDELLRQVAGRIQSLVREDDIVARLGGDEFTLLLPDVDDDRVAAMVCEKILGDLARPFRLGQDEMVVSCSIGVASYPGDGRDSATLLKNADAAMYQAKARGRNNFQFYTAEINARAQQRLSLESAMRRGMENGEFLLHYQPQVNIESGHIIGVEALLRWQHPEQGLISPATFIPVAEDSGLIVPLGEWVMREACRQHQQWIDAGMPLMRMAVNLSARQFNTHLVHMVAGAIRATGVNPEYLELELTESIIMENVEATVDTLYELRDMGVYLSIDDFGTGYSSMAYLKRFPIDKLKIDQSFIRDLARDADDAAIVSATIAMAHSLNLTVIAEGVESLQQLQFLQAHGCEEMQGYYFSRPLPAEDISQLLQQGHSLKPSDLAI
jgi:diguanylate cyclase (GGDEF)-like protein/PAS domain S-box-containing protein